MNRILGIDPGSTVTGFGVIEVLPAKGVVYCASGCIRLGAGAIQGRLKMLFEQLGEVLEEFEPQEVAIERVFVRRNPDSALKLGQARGVAICAVALRERPIAEYSAREVKQAVVGTGAATKGQIQHMVTALLALPAQPPADAADALGVAICHAHRRRLQGVIGYRQGGLG